MLRLDEIFEFRFPTLKDHRFIETSFIGLSGALGIFQTLLQPPGRRFVIWVRPDGTVVKKAHIGMGIDAQVHSEMVFGPQDNGRKPSVPGVVVGGQKLISLPLPPPKAADGRIYYTGVHWVNSKGVAVGACYRGRDTDIGLLWNVPQMIGQSGKPTVKRLISPDGRPFVPNTVDESGVVGGYIDMGGEEGEGGAHIPAIMDGSRLTELELPANLAGAEVDAMSGDLAAGPVRDGKDMTHLAVWRGSVLTQVLDLNPPCTDARPGRDECSQARQAFALGSNGAIVARAKGESQLVTSAGIEPLRSLVDAPQLAELDARCELWHRGWVSHASADTLVIRVVDMPGQPAERFACAVRLSV